MKKTTFLFIFSTYLPLFLLKFRAGELVGCGIKFHTSSHFFRYFLFLGQRGPSKVCSVGTHWMQNLIPHLTSSPDRNLSKNTRRYVKNTNKKSSIFMTNMSIQPLWLTQFIEILLVLEFQLTKTYFGTFSYKAHFRPQISSNDFSVLFFKSLEALINA